ncbi:MAG: ribbon-helix-helix protein, CopG family [Bifidobacteriaceae bacterium]|jgi:hypothetical protein|nr:ribbon-helix-helix protein, CopG family [Bifidobacteriaceae bacterium]
MSDILVRNVPEEDVARLDRAAERLGLSRADYLRQLIAGARELPARRVTLADLDRFAAATPDLGDPDVMRQAW